MGRQSSTVPMTPPPAVPDRGVGTNEAGVEPIEHASCAPAQTISVIDRLRSLLSRLSGSCLYLVTVTSLDGCSVSRETYPISVNLAHPEPRRGESCSADRSLHIGSYRVLYEIGETTIWVRQVDRVL